MLCRGIVSCSVGQCGNQVSEAFWRTIAEEHGVEPTNGSCSGDDQMKERIGVYFNESAENTFLPRAALIDLEPGVLDNIRASDIGPLFRPDSFCNSTASAGNNWAKGHYTEGAELIEPSLDIIRREAETCDVLQGFQVTHSLGGGTGSGMGTLLVSKIREEYPDRILATYSVFPSPKVSNTVTEPYNATLSINQLVEHSDAVFAVDNEALHNICERNFRTPQPSYSELNSLISKVMAGVTCSLRFPGQLNSDMRKLCVNLVPFPRLHFFAVGYEPITMPDSSLYRAMSIAELAAAAFQGDNYMTDIDPRQGRFLTAATYFRGKNISTDEVDNELAKLQSKHTSQSVNWIPHNIKSSVCDQPPPGLAMSNAFVGNHTSINQMFRRISNQFRAMLNRKAYLHWYTAEGMDEMEFREADANLTDLQSEYCQCAETEEGGGDSHAYGGEEE